jgi:hypothetical protein
VRLACAVLALVCCLLIIRYDSRVDRCLVPKTRSLPLTWRFTLAGPLCGIR